MSPNGSDGEGRASAGIGPGSRLGPYVVEAPVGEGAMGRVFVARDERLSRRVAIKVVLGEYAESPEFRARFQREAATLARLDSPHVISIFDHGELGGVPYIVTQYAAGGDLGALLRLRGPMPPALASRLCAQVADALVAAHAVGVVHRDVKPANVLLRDERLQRLHVYLCDFGVVLTEASGLTTPGTVAGTWNYLAPERVEGEHGSPASDVYAVGCLFHEVLTGRPPYRGSDVEVALEHVHAPVPRLAGEDETTRAINEVLARTMAKDPGDRYPSALALRDALRGLAATFSTPPSHTGRSPVLAGSRAGRRRAVLLTAAALALIVVAAGGAFAVLHHRGSSDPAPRPTAAEPVVLGDYDGNGFGDVAWSDDTRSYLHLSDGHGFSPDVVRRNGAISPSVTGDVSGRGHEDLVTVVGSAPTLAVTVASQANADPTSTITVPVPDRKHRLDHPLLALSDVNGDGLADLVVGSISGATITVAVALNAGGLRFAQPTTWAEYREPPGTRSYSTFYLVAGDVNGDGYGDVGVVTAASGASSEHTVVQMLESDGRQKLAAGGPALDFGERFSSSLSLSFDYLGLADVDGDGRLELVGVTSYLPAVVTWRWSRDRFASPHVAYAGTSGKNTATRATISDVDGDGRADVVLEGHDVVSVLRSTTARAGASTYVPDPDFDLETKVSILAVLAAHSYWDAL